MKKISVTCFLVLLFGVIASGSVWAKGGGLRGGGGSHYAGSRHFGGYNHGGWGYRGGFYGLGFGFGPGYYGGYYPYYGWYPPAVVTVPVSPPVYIQQSPPVVQRYQPGYWYYCTNPEGYYPYIKECPYGWQQVAPIPPTHP